MTDLPLVPAPAWLDDLVIYELAPRSFTSPRGPGSGDFAGVTAKLPYLADLGVTGIWLNGYSWSDPRHFYNIWTSYACIDPGRLDPSLGTEADFAQLIDTAHAHGIRVLLEVVTHGVLHASPLVAQHPHWFKDGTWHMLDYDWAGHHPDLDAWWVELWTGYVARFGVDGFRLDVATYRPDLWAEIRRRAAALGHSIVVMAESGPGCTGVIDLLQRGGFKLSKHLHGFDPDAPLARDVARSIHAAAAPQPRYTVTLTTSATAQPALTDQTNHDPRPVVAPDQTQDARVVDQSLRVTPAAGYVRHEDVLTLPSLPDGRAPTQITVDDGDGPPWHYPPAVDQDYAVRIEATAPRLILSVPRRSPPATYFSVQLSCHDDGWEGFPADRTPYTAQGSRYRWGYGCLLAPCVPLFMAGEEFNADYRPLPDLSPWLYGGADAGRGRWLYGSWLAWEQAAQPDKAALWADVQRLLALRRRYRAWIRPGQVGAPPPPLLPVAASGDRDLPVPYLYHADGRGLLIAANPDPTQAVTLRLDLPLAALGWEAATPLRIEDVWADAPPITLPAAAFAQHTWTIPPDGTPRGGLLVLALRTEA